MSRNLRASVDRALALGGQLGYRVRESDCRDIDDTVTVEFDGHRQLIEARFKTAPATGFLRFDRGFIYASSGYADPIETWRRVEETLVSYAELAADALNSHDH